MNLDIFNDLINNTKENSLACGLIKELNEFLENRTTRNQISLLDKLQNEVKITTQYRDKMKIERNNILKDYANKTSEKGTMYYIYGKDAKEENKYLISVCEEGRSHEIIEIEEKSLPKGAGVDSVLRLDNGKFTLDEEATKIVQEKMQETFNKLLNEQEKEVMAKRIEGHLYEFSEKSGDRAWLIDKNMPKNEEGTAFEVFEEIEFPKELLSTAKEEDLYQYINGEYRKVEN